MKKANLAPPYFFILPQTGTQSLLFGGEKIGYYCGLKRGRCHRVEGPMIPRAP